MFSRRLKILVFCDFVILCIWGISFHAVIFDGNRQLWVISAVLLIYSFYITWMIIQEYKLCELDEENGIEEKEMKLIQVKEGSPKGNSPVLVFESVEKDRIDYFSFPSSSISKKFKIGNKYKVQFYRNTEELVKIKEI